MARGDSDPSWKRWVGLVAISVAVGMVVVDATVINIAIAPIVVDLGLNATAAQWTQSAYTLTSAALLLTAGRAADAFGRRRLLLAGIGVFIIGSVIAATATSGVILIAGRVTQGLGAAAIVPTTLALINAAFRGPSRTTAFAVWGSAVGAMAALGPLLGGWLTAQFSWPWIFYINVGVGAIAAAGIWFCVAESRDPVHTRGVDLLGVVLSAAAAASLVFALIEGRTQGWWTSTMPGGSSLPGDLSPVPVALGVFVVALTGFVLWERRLTRLGKPTLLRLSLFTVSTFSQGNVVNLLVALGQFGLIFVLPLWLQNVLGYTPLAAAGLITAIAVGAFIAAAVTPVLALRIGVPWVLRVGLAAEVVSLLALAVILGPEASWTLIAGVLVVFGFGIGTADAQLPSLLLADVPPESSGQAASVQSTSNELGAALGVAVLGTVLFTTLSQVLAAGVSRLGAGAASDDFISGIVDSAGTAIPTITDPALQALAEQAFTDAARAAVLVGAGLLTVALASTVVFRRKHTNSSDQIPSGDTQSATRT